MKKKKTLTPKQQRFCQEYLIDLDATKATGGLGHCSSGGITNGQ